MNLPNTRPGRPANVAIDGAVLRGAREALGIERAALATRLGITARTLQRAENEGMVSAALLARLCEALRLPTLSIAQPESDDVTERLRTNGYAPARAPELIGRDAERARLAAALTGPARRRVVVVSGQIGAGKSSLARAVAHDLARDFPGGVVWVGAGRSDPRDVQLDLGRVLGFEHSLPEREDSSRDWRQAFAAQMARAPRLLVLDDVATPERVLDFAPRGVELTVLVTTRFHHVADAVASDHVALGPLGVDGFVTLLELGSGRALRHTHAPSLTELARLTGCLPAFATLIAGALRKERLTTPDSLLDRLRRAAAAPDASPLGAEVSELFAGLEAQVSAQSWRLFATLGAFATEPFPLSFAAAAAELDLAETRAAASELLDAGVVELHEAGDSEPWLRLPTLYAVAARRLLGPALAATWDRLARHAIACMWDRRRASVAELAAFWRRHHLLIQAYRDAALGPVAYRRDLASLARPDDVVPLAASPEHARLLVDTALALAPLLMDRTVLDNTEWLELALRAVVTLDDPGRRAALWLLAGMWRGFTLGLDPTAFRDAALADFRAAGDRLGEAIAHTLLGYMPSATAASVPPDRFVGEVARLLAMVGPPRAPVALSANLLGGAAQVGYMLSPPGAPDEPGPSGRDTTLEAARAAAQTCRVALAELDPRSPEAAYLAALLRFNAATYDQLAGLDTPEAMARATDELAALEPEPWTRAGLIAHAARFGAAMGHASPEAALDAARERLRELVRDCRAEDAPRLLWFIHSCAFYALLDHPIVGRTHPMVRGGVGRFGVCGRGGGPLAPALCGLDHFVMLSLEATSALLDRPLVELALALAQHMLAGRMTTHALGTLRDLLSQPGLTPPWPTRR